MVVSIRVTMAMSMSVCVDFGDGRYPPAVAGHVSQLGPTRARRVSALDRVVGVFVVVQSVVMLVSVVAVNDVGGHDLM